MLKLPLLPISVVLPGALVLMVLISGAAATVFPLVSATREVKRAEEQRVQFLLSAVDGKVAEILKPVELQVLGLARLFSDHEELLADPRSVLAASASTMPQIATIGVVTPQMQASRVARNSAALINEDWNARPEMVAAMRDAVERRQLAWSEPYFSVGVQEAVLAVRQPIILGERVVGMVVAAVSLRDLSAFVASLDRSQDATFFVVTRRFEVVAHASLSDVARPQRLVANLPRVMDLQDATLISAVLAQSDLEIGAPGQTQRTAIRDRIIFSRDIGVLPGMTWIIGGTIERGGAAFQRDSYFFASVAALVLVLACLPLAWLLGRQIARSVASVSEAAEAVTRFDVATFPRRETTFITEVDRIHKALQRMNEALTTLRLYVPLALTRKILARNGADIAPSETREATVMFTDMVGFSRLAEQRSPTETTELLNAVFAAHGAAIEGTSGVVDKFVGDAVVAFWGIPDCLEDHSRRAVEAALRLRIEVEHLNFERQKLGREPLRLRVGLHAGPVTVGNVGYEGRWSYTIIGDTVNVAKRLEQLGDEVEADEAVVIVASLEVIEAAAVKPKRLLGPRVTEGRAQPVRVALL